MLSAKCPNALLSTMCLFIHVHDNTPAQNYMTFLYSSFYTRCTCTLIWVTHFLSESYRYCVTSYLINLVHFGRIMLTSRVQYCIDSPSVAHCFSQTQKQSLYTNIYFKQYYNKAYTVQKPYLHHAL